MQLPRHLCIIALLSSACTETLSQALARLPRTQPDPPITTEDSATAAALREALASGYVRGPRIIVANGNGKVRSASLPKVDSVTFLLLTPEHIQALADEYGDLGYTQVLPPIVTDSEVRVSLVAADAFSRPQHPYGVIFGGSVCELRLARREGQWRIHRPGVCLVS